MLEFGTSSFFAVISQPLIFGALAGALFAFVFSLQNSLLPYSTKLRANLPVGIGFALPISLVAFVAGYLTGVSRSPAVGTIIPAVLTLVGGLNIYLFGIDVKNRSLVGFSVFLFTLFLFYGVQAGSYHREIGREARLIFLSEQERKIRIFRENRDLSPDMPAWITTGEPR
ncbi:hypothetical protein AB7813_29625 [Tardiphaga sp. 20_F10_N6_6]|jgi:uncharacterized membrane protein YjjB (DUF3815 family)|uniref:hypothetical protein n=1 Tax=unclassified Tardiphaga TaxID=2631404 RepID=UPI003F299790